MVMENHLFAEGFLKKTSFLSMDWFLGICYRKAPVFNQWEFQDPIMEVLYHIRPYFVGIFPYIGLKSRPYIWQVPPINRFLKWPLI